MKSLSDSSDLGDSSDLSDLVHSMNHIVCGNMCVIKE